MTFADLDLQGNFHDCPSDEIYHKYYKLSEIHGCDAYLGYPTDIGRNEMAPVDVKKHTLHR